MLRWYKYRIYPTDEQKVLLAKTFGCCRYVYNWALELKERTYKEEKRVIVKNEMQYIVRWELREKMAPWIKEVSEEAVSYAIDDLYEGYNRFFKGLANHPKFHKKGSYQSFRDRGRRSRVNFKSGTISIPKVKEIPCVYHRRFKGSLKQVSIELVPSGKYIVGCLVDDGKPEPIKAPIDPEKTIGIDTGLNHYIVTTDGLIDEPTHEAKKQKRKLKLLSRRLSKKEYGSRQFRILKKRIARLHEHTANRRTDHIHKLTHYLACENQATTICVEDLNIKGLMKNKHLAYSIQDAAIGEFYRQLKYKCAWAGKNYIEIDRFAPSSKRCSHCGHIYKGLTLKEREWTCHVCGTRHDRDLNAAINIKHFGLNV